MAYLVLPDYNDSLNYMRGESVDLTSGGGSGAPGGSGTSAPTAPVSNQTQQRQSPINIQQTASSQNIINPVKADIAGTQGDIAKAWETFQGQAGPSRTFEGIGAQGTLQSAIQAPTTAPDYSQKLEAAKGILGSTYTGPTQIADTSVQDIKAKGTAAEEQTKALQTGSGIQALLGKQMPTLTAGEKRYEAQQISLSPEYRAYKAQAPTDISAMWKQLSDTQTQATTRATERASQEKAIGEQAKGYLTGERSGIVQDWDKKVAETAAKEAATTKAWQDFQNKGDLTSIQAMTPEMRAASIPANEMLPWQTAPEWTPEQFNSPNRQLLSEAETAYNKIMNDPKYAGIQTADTLGLKSNKKGQEQYNVAGTMPAQAGTMVTEPTKMTTNQKQLTIQRQQELEAAGFSPGSARENTYGKYATMMPLYYAEGGPQNAKWQPEDYRFYLQYLPGGSPTRENMSSTEQKTIYNNIETLLEEVDRIAEEGEPFKAAKIAANIEQFTADEGAALTERKDALTKGNKDWMGQLAKIHKAYDKAKKKSMWGKIVSVITGVATGGLTTGLSAASKSLPGIAGQAAGLANKAVTYGTIGAALPAIAGLPLENTIGLMKATGTSLGDITGGIKTSTK